MLLVFQEDSFVGASNKRGPQKIPKFRYVWQVLKANIILLKLLYLFIYF